VKYLDKFTINLTVQALMITIVQLDKMIIFKQSTFIFYIYLIL